jgi:hypothetical protein
MTPLPSEHSRKHWKPESSSESDIVLRFVRKNRWESKNPASAADVAQAGADFKLRPSEPSLSFYIVLDAADARRIATAFKMIQRDKRPDHIDFMLVSRTILAESGISLKSSPDPDLPMMLSSRHMVTIAPRHEPTDELIRKLLEPIHRDVLRVRREEAVELAKSMVAEDPNLLEWLGSHWRAAIDA